MLKWGDSLIPSPLCEKLGLEERRGFEERKRVLIQKGHKIRYSKGERIRLDTCICILS